VSGWGGVVAMLPMPTTELAEPSPWQLEELNAARHQNTGTSSSESDLYVLDVEAGELVLTRSSSSSSTQEVGVS